MSSWLTSRSASRRRARNLAQVTAELLELLTTAARVDARSVTGSAPDGAKSAGLAIGELVVTGVLSAASVRAAASVLSSWLQGRAKRKVTLKAGDDEIVLDGPLTRAQQELVTALAERRRRLERAVLAVRLAADDGVVLGGGVALAGAADVLDASNPAHAAWLARCGSHSARSRSTRASTRPPRPSRCSTRSGC
ncbi:hypothetical protein [Lentzea sp. CC55]|uniref:hypothetical protein n=1 Tax=Lentzea sp. CC55 TaxID=2884909 RepID=UPI001F1D7F11|nr:hypothetical protein [Lentzea sp. CC55]MCG8922364.1 hypothetical protein [Lentzea sp. CC55]